MRELNECKAEIFRRSEKRIKERRRKRRRILALCLPLCLLIAVLSATVLPSGLSAKSNTASNEEQLVLNNTSDAVMYSKGSSDSSTHFGSFDSFSFSLTWGCYGASFYDSESGKLVKTKEATNPENYITAYRLTEAQKQKIYDLILNLDVTSYPDIYNPQKEGITSSPSMTLILSVKTDTLQKTITAEDIALTYASEDPEGQEFLSVCKAIRDILTETEEWKALPENEYIYS